jgi:hypothetical protein
MVPLRVCELVKLYGELERVELAPKEGRSGDLELAARLQLWKCFVVPSGQIENCW